MTAKRLPDYIEHMLEAVGQALVMSKACATALPMAITTSI
jgi:hypothetical protein